MKATMAKELLNGFDVKNLEKNMAAMKADPALANFQFSSSTQWKKGAVVASTFAGLKQGGQYLARPKPFELAGDEPQALLGTGTAVPPTGHLLHALSHSFALSMAYHGAARGVKINSLKIDAEGIIDLQGLLGLNENINPGFQHIHLTVRVDSPASTTEILDLFQFAQARSPIAATLSNSVPVDWRFEIKASGAGPDTSDVRHGVNVKDLNATIGAIQQNPVLAKCKFYSTSEWLGGARVKSASTGFDQAEGDLTIRHRTPEPMGYVGDEPKQLVGTDTGPSSEEALLQAMANCISVTSSYHAAARGLELDTFNVDFEGDTDSRGLALADGGVTPGFQKILAKVRVNGGGTREAIEDLMNFAASHSPMCASVERPVQLTYSLIHNGKEVAGPA
jgi:uncharacterized OsmC-like protein